MTVEREGLLVSEEITEKSGLGRLLKTAEGNAS